MNLDQVLRHRACPRYYPSRLRPKEKIHEHWLWHEIKGVCGALSVFHRKMKSLFPNDGEPTIELHFDLKPANILVTADGKLQITDFGQFIVQTLCKGEDKIIHRNAWDSRYAAPESRPTFDLKDGPEDIEVFLNYDVWSLGCIMVEILIHILDLDTLESFDQRLSEEQLTGFSRGSDLETCVSSSLQNFEEMFHDSPQRHYTAGVTKLIRGMLRHDRTRDHIPGKSLMSYKDRKVTCVRYLSRSMG